MAKISLARLSVAELLKLRDDIGVILRQKTRDIERLLARLGGEVIGKRRRGHQASALMGRKVAPKYRDPASGDTWAGRGARPQWLVARLKEGKKLQDFLIDKSAKKARKGSKKRAHR